MPISPSLLAAAAIAVRTASAFPTTRFLGVFSAARAPVASCALQPGAWLHATQCTTSHPTFCVRDQRLSRGLE
eukprot:5974848-Prymnesium_polylepis.1